MEVYQISEDHSELLKERAAAAAERAAASQERSKAAAERKAICASLDRLWLVLSNTIACGGLSNSNMPESMVQQTKQVQQDVTAASAIQQEQHKDKCWPKHDKNSENTLTCAAEEVSVGAVIEREHAVECSTFISPEIMIMNQTVNTCSVPSHGVNCSLDNVYYDTADPQSMTSAIISSPSCLQQSCVSGGVTHAIQHLPEKYMSLNPMEIKSTTDPCLAVQDNQSAQANQQHQACLWPDYPVIY